MRGTDEKSRSLFSCVDLEDRIPVNHPLRKIRQVVNDALASLDAYPGEHAAIIDTDIWEGAHSILQESPRKRANNSRAQTPALLKGLIFSDTGAAMTPTSTKNGVNASGTAGSDQVNLRPAYGRGSRL